jgi:plasmid maintenance system antidote protein VapI
MKWFNGEKAALARAAGMKQRELNNFARGSRKFSVEMARVLEDASARVLGETRRIPAAAWLRLEGHPLIENFVTRSPAHCEGDRDT